MYAPKCLVIVSRQDYIDTFRNCLGIIYTVWVENLGVPLETLVGNLVGCVLVPGAGGPQVRFSIGAGDRQALQPPAAPPMPVTHTAVHMLLRLLGIHNSVTLWCAVMSEHKVLLVSLAAARLSAACRALAALMFPFRYAHVYIPLLPAGLAEVLATPTPFLIGVHSSLKEEVSELLDVIVADLDVGSLHIPAGVNIPRPEGKLLGSLQEALALVLQPELRSADSAFAPPPPAASPPHMLDKEIRAVFMRTLAKLLQGYRHCLTIIRIHPSPVLTFHKAGFLGSRGLAACPFAVRLLDSMFFNGLVAERGPPWRPTDIFDELVQNLPEQLRLESLNPDIELQHIQDLAMQLHLNENPNPQTYQQRVLRPPAGAEARIHQPPLPALDPLRVRDVIRDVSQRNANNAKLTALRPPQARIVPPAAPPTGGEEPGQLLLTNSARRLEVLRACVAAIFEGRYADARKSFPAVLRALRAPAARSALVRDLAARLPTNKHLLQHHQFELLVCTEGGVTADHVRCLHQMIPGVVHMHLETLDAVARESRRLPPVQKARIVAPSMVPGEAGAAPALRAVLVADGRESPLLPAEGALFLTNYRLVFKGTPIDPFACEQTVVRSFPLCALTREKAVRAHGPQLEPLSDGLQLRAATFQLIKVVLDEEVSGEQAEAFRKQVARLRHPASAVLHFALAPRPAPPPPLHATKHHTLKGFAKKTLLKTARRAGLKPKPSKRQKYVLPSADARSLTSPPLMSSLSADTLSLEELELGGTDSAEPPAARTLERVRERIYARDWARLGLASAPFRLTHANAIYTLCRSYPCVVAVPAAVSDESLRRAARCYRQGRLPALTWRHPRTHALLARSSASHHKGVMGMLKGSSHQTPGTAQSGTEPTSSLEQERYLSALIACTPAGRGELEAASLSLESLLLPEDHHTPLLAKATGTLGVLGRNSGGKGGAAGGRHFGRWGSLKDRRQPSHLELYVPKQRLSTADLDSVCGESSGGGGGARRAALYVLTDKGGAGGVSGGGAEAPAVQAVPVEYPDARATKHAFKKLLRAAAPSAPPQHDHPGFLRLVEESGWLWQLRQLFQLSGAVVDLLDLQGSSVLLSLEDGWDVTSQISSLAQICLEPYYRTLEGFRILVEKEWLAMGHKFQQRSNLAAAPQQGFTPTFLMFLDAVHQLVKQFPLAFEFNDYYLRFVAYHSVSCRFRTFLFDSEAQRAELGLAHADDRRADVTRLGVETGAGAGEEECGGRAAAHGVSLFDFVERVHQRTPLFYNFLYTPDFDNPVLRPVSAINCLEVWEYYVSEELSHGAPYDLDLVPNGDAEPRAARRVVTAGYDSVSRCMPDAFSGLLERVRQLELELGHLPQKWRVRWDQLELPNTLELQRNASMCSSVVRRATAAAHRRGTLEVLVRGLAAAPQHAPHAPHAAPAHRWAPAAHAAPARCDHCGDLLWGPLETGVRCVDCGAACHERCAETFALPCTKYKAPPPDRDRDLRTNVANSVATLQSSSQQYYEQFSSNVAEDRTHEGHLYKRGALLKGWKQRWFVLDSIKHQLRYYDAMEDSHCKGFIDLAEVITVTQAAPAPGPPKKCDDRSFFDLRTSRRTYNFCASDANAAQEWIEKLQACLQ
ncbi:PREDICTED: myotubularin-related protein 5 [Papilio xuthus]|uniref:Myotubularin-related protein 5 n=1 Tax=Papilio xuthus TaxID=66420 RepID=A0AAJ6ZF45_PAPXU|nr:PREDICTED: myotubularin-related protein 5 [Papilio xuthus]